MFLENYFVKNDKNDLHFIAFYIKYMCIDVNWIQKSSFRTLKVTVQKE